MHAPAVLSSKSHSACHQPAQGALLRWQSDKSGSVSLAATLAHYQGCVASAVFTIYSLNYCYVQVTKLPLKSFFDLYFNLLWQFTNGGALV